MRHLILATLLLAACAPDPTMEMQNEQERQAKPVGTEYAAHTQALEQTPRVKVTRVDVFKDNLAYNDRRGIYLIQDKVSGKEFIGISGVGITETGRHSSGKTSVSDER